MYNTFIYAYNAIVLAHNTAVIAHNASFYKQQIASLKRKAADNKIEKAFRNEHKHDPDPETVTYIIRDIDGTYHSATEHIEAKRQRYH